MKDNGTLRTSKGQLGRKTYRRADYTTQNVRRNTRFAINNQSAEQQSQADGPEVRDHGVNLYSRELNYRLYLKDGGDCGQDVDLFILQYMDEQSTF